ncbi:acyl-CoA dehydrogenase family protein [Streptomyces cucumeris]|uniref:acyl-CoA dehydrogenase family protein n=1 Tax=Streptomyces cucumeris TaxID=2962890 RepID=UPI003D73A121
MDTAEVKWWTTELQVDIANHCLQIHGGHGYLKERSPRNEANGRVQTIYGGTTEVIKEPVRRSRPAPPG